MENGMTKNVAKKKLMFVKGKLFAVFYYFLNSEYIKITTKYMAKIYLFTNIILTSTDDRFDKNCRGGYDLDLTTCCSSGNCREGEGRTKTITLNILSYWLKLGRLTLY